ncbi:unnamed protein product [Caenorhabditis auriculariae]|uniref:DNA mismatch repair protein n=1 Tax=Caenorhabditis auriculariae TaxID=2777116 RepID=A0A8S1HI44_9PELO|nr:unnamed protein product [Caenorhabditis auriculariae]
MATRLREGRSDMVKSSQLEVLAISPAVHCDRRRVVVSSDDEDVTEEKKTETPRRNLVESTPKSRKPLETPKRKGELNSEMAESFIESFRFTKHEVASSVDTPRKSSENPFAVIDEFDKFEHEKLTFLLPGKRRDAEKRLETDPEYDPTTLFVPADFLSKQTPGHKQWWIFKSKHFDTVLLFKVGKFYELYHMDASTAVSCLNIAFMRGSYAHCGFPEHAYGKFADQLVARGHKVARIEQTETPAQLEERNLKSGGPKEKVVKRELCRITSVGTKTYGILDGVELGQSNSMGDTSSKHLLAIKESVDPKNSSSIYGVCCVDTSTGAFQLSQFNDDEYRSFLRTFIANNCIAQVLIERGSYSPGTKALLNGMLCSVPTEVLAPGKDFYTCERTVKELMNSDLLGSEVSEWPIELRRLLDPDSVLPKPSPQFSLVWSALGAVLFYLKKCMIHVDIFTMNKFTFSNQKLKPALKVVDGVTCWDKKVLVLDGTTLENLNIVPNNSEIHATSLYNILNKCATPFGRRLLRTWLCAPTCDGTVIKERQDAVEWLASAPAKTFVQKATTLLRTVPDLERLLQKIHTLGSKYRAEKHPDSRAQMFDTTRTSKRKIKELVSTIRGFKTCHEIRKLYDTLRMEGEGCELLDECLGIDELRPHLENNIKHFEKIFDHDSAMEKGKIEPKAGVDEMFEEACENVKKVESRIEGYRKKQEKALQCEITFSGTGRNRYQMEIPDTIKPSSKFEMKGQRKKFKRYMTDDLQELIEELGAAERSRDALAEDATRKMFELFDLRREEWIEAYSAISKFDVVLSLAKFATSSGLQMCRPEFDYKSAKPYVDIVDGVHPCLALQTTGNFSTNVPTTFIANDTRLGGDAPEVMLLTGPNMGGKSTLMRQTAVLCVLAHLGSLVPASSMKLTPVDRIFTRIGANDRIMCGQSTFYVELNEMQVMLRDATIHSMLLIDELGRGTSTFDGTAIASAVLQHLADFVKSRAFFSTHYHSICSAVAGNPNILMAHMACKVENENDEDPTDESVTFLYRLAEGICPKSYGFFAAKLAGINEKVVRAAFAASNRFAEKIENKSSTSCSKMAQLRTAARDSSVSVEQLRRMLDSF